MNMDGRNALAARHGRYPHLQPAHRASSPYGLKSVLAAIMPDFELIRRHPHRSFRTGVAATAQEFGHVPRDHGVITQIFRPWA
jgi:hypothetical protein